jgi:type I restriction enzyme S subunit
MSEWKYYNWGDLVELKYGKSLKDYREKNQGYRVFGTNGPIGFNEEFLYDKPSIIIGRKGAYRGVEFSDEPFYVIDTAFYTVKKVDFLDEKFGYYQLLTKNINALDSGSAIPSTSKDDFYSIEAYLPPKYEQIEVRKILDTINKKITLLRQQNQTLEELAQTLFKRWFVEFEFPDENGRPYKSAGGKMVESELGEIPEGWRVGPLSSIAEFLNGLACQKYPVKNKNEKLPVLKIKELGNGISETTDWATSNVDEKYIVKNGDIIFSWSGTLLLKLWNGSDCLLNQHLFKVTSSEFPNWFIFHWTNLHLKHFIAVAESKATTMGHIKRSHLDEALCVIPSKRNLKYFSGAFSAMFDLFVNNNK